MKTVTQPAASKPSPGTQVLVDPQWLHAHLDDPRVRVVEVDVSPAAYDDWHIDGAVLWNIYQDLKDADYRLADTAVLEALLERSGIRPDSTVVFYGYAPALGFWLMKLYGHADVRILDCSRDTWKAEGHPWSTTASHVTGGNYRLGERGPTHPSGPSGGAGRHRPARHDPRRRAVAGGIPGRALLALWRHGTGRPSRPRTVRRPPAHRRPLRPARLVPRCIGPAQRLLVGRSRRRPGS